MNTKKMRGLFLALGSAICLAGLSAQVKVEDLAGPAWAQWRGPSGNSMVKETVSPAAVAGAKVLWTQSVGQGYAAVHPVGQYAFTTGRLNATETLFCLDVRDGKRVWQYKIGGNSGDFPGTRSSPLILDGKVYCMNRDGLAYCLNAADGSLVWQSDVAALSGAAKPHWGFASSPVRIGELLVFNMGSNGAAIRLSDGKLAWKSGSDGTGYASVVPFAFKGQTLAVLFASAQLHVVDPKTGKALASAPWQTSYDVNAADPLVSGNQILVSSDYGKGAALFAFDGASLWKVWENQALKSHFSSMVAVDGYVYGNDGDANASMGSFVCLELASGKEVWRQDGGVGSLIAVGDKLLTLSERGRLALAELNPKGYSELAAMAKVGSGQYWPAPTIAGGKVFVRNNNGGVSCIGLDN
jgi:outer membrane protein assembly factor BamB